MHDLLLACALCSVVQARSEAVGARLTSAEVRKVAEAAHDAARYWDVPADVVLAVIEHESRYDIKAVGGGKDFGLMQVRRNTAREVARVLKVPRGVLRTPTHNVHVGTAYLRLLYRRFRSWPRALTAYNRGPCVFVQDGKAINDYARRVLKRRERIRGLLRKVPKRRS